MAKALTGRPKAGHEKNRKRHLGFRVTDTVADAIERVAKRKNISKADIMTEALEKYLDDHLTSSPS